MYALKRSLFFRVKDGDGKKPTHANKLSNIPFWENGIKIILQPKSMLIIGIWVKQSHIEQNKIKQKFPFQFEYALDFHLFGRFVII